MLPDPRPYVLWCPVCGHRDWAADADLARFARDGWPPCCGRAMFCYAETDPGAAPHPPTCRCRGRQANRPGRPPATRG